jgi:hypothetical protein
MVDQTISLNSPSSGLTTKGMYGVDDHCRDADARCATLRASPGFANETMFFGAATASSLTLDHVNFDGDRLHRTVDSAVNCGEGKGRNAILRNVQNAKIQYSGFYRALCGTSLALGNGESNVLIKRNVIADNGDNAVSGRWSDGITIGTIANSRVENNWFYNNSDVSLIFGEAPGTIISGNEFHQTVMHVFAAMMFTNWTVFAPTPAGYGWADSRGAIISDNRFMLGSKADIAIQIGVITWGGGTFSPYAGSLRTMGGTFQNNVIDTDRQGINVAGGGTPAFPVVLSGNAYLNSGGVRLPASHLQLPTSALNIQGPGDQSFVSGDTTGATYNNWDGAF